MSIIKEEPAGTFYTNPSGTYPLERLVRVSGVPFNIPTNATLGMLGVDQSLYDELDEIKRSPDHFNLVIRASQNMLTNGDVIHMLSEERQELIEELDFFSLPPLPKLPTLHNSLTAIHERLHTYGRLHTDAHCTTSFHYVNGEEIRVIEIRVMDPTLGSGPDFLIRKYPGHLILPRETLNQEITGIDRIGVYVSGYKYTAIRMLTDPINVSDPSAPPAFLHIHSSSNYMDVQLKIRFGEWLEDGEEWTRKWGLRYQEIDRKREEMIKFGIGKAKREEAAISKVPHAPSARSHLPEVRRRRLKRTREDQDSTQHRLR